jgi:hypothetical protein
VPAVGERVQIHDRTWFNGRVGVVTQHNHGEIGVTFGPELPRPTADPGVRSAPLGADAWFTPSEVAAI